MNKIYDLQCKSIRKLAGWFMLVVLLFSYTYWLLGFNLSNGVINNGVSTSLLESLYFSVVTITTLGYGDFTPSGFSRFFSGIESIFGLIFVGFGITQVLSIKQDEVLNYLIKDRMLQTFKAHMKDLDGAKEIVADHRRLLNLDGEVDLLMFHYNRSNPFYPALKSMQTMNGYAKHVKDIGKISDLVEYIERASHHVEESINFSRRYVNALDNNGIEWRTPRTVEMLVKLCDAANVFSNEFIQFTKYETQMYKNGDLYQNTLFEATTRLRVVCEG